MSSRSRESLLHPGTHPTGAQVPTQSPPRCPGSSGRARLIPVAPNWELWSFCCQILAAAMPESSSPKCGGLGMAPTPPKSTNHPSVAPWFLAELLKRPQSSRSSGRSRDSHPGSAAPPGMGLGCSPRIRELRPRSGHGRIGPKTPSLPTAPRAKIEGGKHLEEPRAQKSRAGSTRRSPEPGGAGRRLGVLGFASPAAARGAPNVPTFVASLSPLIPVPPEPPGRDRDLFPAPGKAPRGGDGDSGRDWGWERQESAPKESLSHPERCCCCWGNSEVRNAQFLCEGAQKGGTNP